MFEGKYWHKRTGGICERETGFDTGRRRVVSGGGKGRIVRLTRDTAGRSRETILRFDRLLSISIRRGGAGAVDDGGVIARGSLWRVVHGVLCVG